MRTSPILLSLLLLAACKANYDVIEVGDTGGFGSDPDDTDDTDESDTGDPDPVWDTAWLSIVTPTSGAFLPLGEPADFQAHVYDEHGATLDYGDISWSSSVDSAWSMTGASFSDDSLAPGKHDIKASTQLPNGDRLAHTVGGVLVQSPYSGTYTGTLYVTTAITYEGVPYASSCAGAATVVVEPDGRAVLGDANCLMSLMGYYDMDMGFIIDATNSEGDVDGTISVDMGFYAWGLDSSGSATEDGHLTMSFADTVSMYVSMDLEGTLDVTRISRDTELEG